MTTRIPCSNLLLVLCVAALVIGATLLAGCTQPSPSQNPSTPPLEIFPTPTASPTPAYVTASKLDTSHIVVAVRGGPDRARILQVDATVTDDRGQFTTQHIGDKLATSPVGGEGTIRFTGLFSQKTHVSVSGFFTDGSTRSLLETDI